MALTERGSGRQRRSATARPPDTTRYRRSPRALGVALVGLVIAAAVFSFSHLLDQTDRGVREDAREASDHLPGTAGTILDSLAMTLVVLLVVALVADQLQRRRARAATTAVLAVVVAAGAVHLLAALQVDERWVGASGWGRGVAAGAAAAGAAGAATIALGGGRWLRSAAWMSAGIFVVAGAWSVESVGGRLWLLGVGAAVGAVALLAVGTPSQHATAEAVADGLRAIGMVPRRVEPASVDARSSVPWLVELRSGSRLFVKTATSEERIADLLFRLWRRIRLKDSGDTRPAASLEHAAEHEAFAASRALTVGVQAPRVLGLGRLADGGVFSIHEAIDGQNLSDLVEERGADALDEARLREIWSMVTTLHRGRIAHRDLRAANIVIDQAGSVWIVDFAFADLVPGADLQRKDLVELLCSTAALVGPERAVDAAVTTLGEETWRDALPLIQPLATSAATRAALGSDGFVSVRRQMVDRVEAAEPDLPRLGRLDRRTLFSVLAIGVGTWVMLPQLGQSGEVWRQLPKADPVLLALAAACSAVTYVGAAASLIGAVPRRLPPIRTVIAQLASSFANRVTPAKVGGFALNVRWMVKEGVEAPVAAAGVSINAVAGFIVHSLSALFVLLWAGQSGLGDLRAPSGRTIAAAVGLVAAVVAVTYAIPSLRRTVRHRVWPRTRQSLGSILEVGADRRRLVLLFGGSALVTSSYIAALALSVAAVGAHLPVATVALVYLAGSVVASAAPTPGGLGATEATFAAALTTVGAANPQAVSAVLLYRLATFWLPILPGWLAYGVLRRADRL